MAKWLQYSTSNPNIVFYIFWIYCHVCEWLGSLHARVYTRVFQMKFISELFWEEEKRYHGYWSRHPIDAVAILLPPEGTPWCLCLTWIYGPLVLSCWGWTPERDFMWTTSILTLVWSYLDEPYFSNTICWCPHRLDLICHSISDFLYL
jgi:hypothetical protein